MIIGASKIIRIQLYSETETCTHSLESVL
jgi:hypothetical protein